MAGEGEAGREFSERQSVAHQTRGTEPAVAQELPDGSLLRESPGVGAHQALLVLEEIVEREACRLSRPAMGEEHGRSSWPECGQSSCGEGAAADTVEHRVGASPILTAAARGGEELRAGQGRCVGSELDRQPPAVFARVDHYDVDLRAEGAQHEEVEEAHAAAAEDRGHPPLAPARAAWGRADRREDGALAQAPEDAGRRLEKDRVEILQTVRNPARGRGEGACPDQYPAREAAGFEEILAECRALSLRAAGAVEAGAAGGVMGNDHPVAGRETGDSRADREHFAHDFVSEHRTGRSRAGRQLEEIGAAESAPPQAQDELAGARNRSGSFAEPRLAVLIDRDDVHHGVSFHQMERRIHRRFARRIELRYWRPGETQGHTAYTTNISKSGLFLSSATALAPGERLRLEIIDREGGFFAEGRVARVHRVSLALRQVEQQGVGVRFLLPEELVESLVPLARQSGPATQGGRPHQAEPPGASDGGSQEALAEVAAAHGPVGAPGGDLPLEREPAGDIARDRIVPVSFADPSAFLSTYHRDISAGGLFVSTPTPMALQAEIWIEMQLPIPGERPRLFAARVIQRFEPQAAVGPGRNYLSGMAVQFIEPEKVLAELKPLLAVLRR